VATITPTLGLSRSIIESRQQLENLQKQLATGKKVQTYGDLGLDRTQILSFRSELSQIKGYQNSISILDVRLDVMISSMERIRESATISKSDAHASGFELQSTGQTIYQTEVANRFDEAVALLNNEVNGRHLFGGRSTEGNPVVPASQILDGAGGLAGFRQIADERRQADLGADGLGRLVLDGPHAAVLGGVVATPADIGGVAAAQFSIDIGGNLQTFDVSDGGLDTLAALEAAIDTAFGADVASIVGGNQLQIAATDPTESIAIADVDAGAAALAGLTAGVATNPTATASITEDSATSPFGFKLAAVNSNLSGTTVTGPVGSPANLDVAFSGTLPSDGEAITVTLDLPDGTQHDLTLTARASGPLQPGEFLIGADENVTADNFQTAAGTAFEVAAQTALSAASLFEASDNFFDFDEANPPQRVNGPPYDTATSLVDATATDTVIWYQGEVSSTSARQSSSVKVDDSISVAAGVRADEQGLVQTLKTFAALAVETFDPNDVNGSQRYNEIKERTSNELSFINGAQSPREIVTELTIAKTTAGQAAERHKISDALIKDTIGEKENADIYEVSAQILALQVRIEASLQVSASISQISIINFI